MKINLKEQLRKICKEYHDRAAKIENLKYDLEHEVVIKDYEVTSKLCQRYVLRKMVVINHFAFESKLTFIARFGHSVYFLTF